MNQAGALLAILAHPDDESFAMGGTLARYAAQGIQVFLVCATRGEVGEISDPTLATPETLGQVREEELRNACRVLGIHQPIFLGYRDSGMADTPYNQHPASLNQASPEEVTERLRLLLCQWKPEAVITFDAHGGYGHPDHIAVHRYTTTALSTIGQEATSPRLYYSTIPRSFFRIMVSRAPSDSPFHQRDPETMGTPDEDITTQIDVSAYVDAKMKAIACHRTQMRADGPFSRFPPEELAHFLGTEYFIRALPPFKGSRRQQDLFS